MFDSLPDPAACGALSRPAMVTAIEGYEKAEAIAVARKLALIDRLLADHEGAAAAVEKKWAHDTWAAVAGEVGAALGISSRRASGQITQAKGLARRLPKVAALLERGVISSRIAATIVYRTALVQSGDAQQRIDTGIADIAGSLGVLSDDDVALSLDIVIEQHDPNACRRFREAARNCDVGFGKPDDATGTASVYGRIYRTDAELAQRILDELAATVCNDDPRSLGERRAAGYGAMLRREDRLVCQCGNTDCTAATKAASSSVVIYVLAEQATVDTALADAEVYDRRERERRPHPATENPTTDVEPQSHNDAAAPAVPSPATEDAEVEDGEAPAEDQDEDDVPFWATRATQAAHEEAAAAAAEKAAAATAEASGEDDDDVPFWATRATQAAHEEAAAAAEKAAADEANAAAEQSAEATANPEVDRPATEEPATEDASPPQPSIEMPAAQPDFSSSPDREPVKKATRPAVSLNGTVIPDPLLAELIRTGTAILKPLPTAGQEPQSGDTFTGTLRRFIQCRDMKCRFPGCNRKAQYADIDHTNPYGNSGPTHASNGKLLCREHHLCKTFRGGPNGWRETQLPDGTIIWTLPTGHTRTTKPRSALVLPDWDTTTAALPPPKQDTRAGNTGTTMPKRKRTREQDREQRIKAEREYNAAQRALGEVPLRR